MTEKDLEEFEKEFGFKLLPTSFKKPLSEITKEEYREQIECLYNAIINDNSNDDDLMIEERIDELIIVYQERIRMENKFRDEELEELKAKILKDSLVSIEDKYTDLAKKIDYREKEIHRMEYFINELKLIKKEIKAYE